MGARIPLMFRRSAPDGAEHGTGDPAMGLGGHCPSSSLSGPPPCEQGRLPTVSVGASKKNGPGTAIGRSETLSGTVLNASASIAPVFNIPPLCICFRPGPEGPDVERLFPSGSGEPGQRKTIFAPPECVSTPGEPVLSHGILIVGNSAGDFLRLHVDVFGCIIVPTHKAEHQPVDTQFSL